jgi:hypothetical protein
MGMAGLDVLHNHFQAPALTPFLLDPLGLIQATQA